MVKEKKRVAESFPLVEIDLYSRSTYAHLYFSPNWRRALIYFFKYYFKVELLFIRSFVIRHNDVLHKLWQSSDAKVKPRCYFGGSSVVMQLPLPLLSHDRNLIYVSWMEWKCCLQCLILYVSALLTRICIEILSLMRISIFNRFAMGLWRFFPPSLAWVSILVRGMRIITMHS